MAIRVDGTDDAAAALDGAQAFLDSRPAEHNLVHTLLAQRARHPEPGRYWIARDGHDVVGVVFLSPLTYPVTITPTPVRAVDALVQEIAQDVPGLIGANGDVTTVARFAGEWAARCGVPVTTEEPQRLYRLGTLVPPRGVSGTRRPARSRDLELLTEWADGFRADTGLAAVGDNLARMALDVDDGLVSVWDDGGARSMATLSAALGGVVRVRHVFTPRPARGRGYASAIVAALSAHALAQGASTCLLYTQLSNPTSNAIYRAIGYEPVAETLRYRFG